MEFFMKPGVKLNGIARISQQMLDAIKHVVDDNFV